LEQKADAIAPFQSTTRLSLNAIAPFQSATRLSLNAIALHTLLLELMRCNASYAIFG
jgi:hypothetical protein